MEKSGKFRALFSMLSIMKNQSWTCQATVFGHYESIESTFSTSRAISRRVTGESRADCIPLWGVCIPLWGVYTLKNRKTAFRDPTRGMIKNPNFREVTVVFGVLRFTGSENQCGRFFSGFLDKVTPPSVHLDLPPEISKEIHRSQLLPENLKKRYIEFTSSRAIWKCGGVKRATKDPSFLKWLFP